MERLSLGTMDLLWNPASRVATLKFGRHATGAQAEAAVAALRRWIGPEPKPFALLSDASEGEDESADWRSIWADFYVNHRDDGFIVGFGVSPTVQVTGALWAAGWGAKHFKTFGPEADARAWLREGGFQA